MSPPDKVNTLNNMYHVQEDMLLDLNAPQKLHEHRDIKLKDLVSRHRLGPKPVERPIKDESRGARILSLAVNDVVKQKEKDKDKSQKKLLFNKNCSIATPPGPSRSPNQFSPFSQNKVARVIELQDTPIKESEESVMQGNEKHKLSYFDDPIEFEIPNIRRSKPEINFDLMDCDENENYPKY